MSEFSGARTHWPRIFAGLALGLASGALFAWAGTPIPWMMGPLVGMGIAQLCGAKLHLFPYGRQAGQWVIGTSVGLYFMPTALVALLSNLGWIFLGAVLTLIMAGIGGLLLSRMSGIDKTSCYFATVPGGAAEMSVLAMRYGGNVPAVAITQSMRIALLVLIVPPALTLAGFAGIDRAAAQLLPPFVADKFFILISITLIVAAVCAKLRIQNAWMMGPLICSAALTASGLTLSRVPVELVDWAQVMLGLALGSRFERDFFARYRMFIPYAIFNALFLMAACGACAWAIAWGSGSIALGDSLLGLAPGGIGEMAITAKGLELGVAVVTAFQFVRISAANFTPPFLFPLARQWRERWLARRG
ncbi:MAG TPA: AbrB family transcriptional regulator [Alphaproteobacteria bacterium]|nr:AbrB family transcriptional regulator [Alphaproteobacteria bacterium]